MIMPKEKNENSTETSNIESTNDSSRITNVVKALNPFATRKVADVEDSEENLKDTEKPVKAENKAKTITHQGIINDAMDIFDGEGPYTRSSVVFQNRERKPSSNTLY
jgi:C1A family cysteine protease